MKILFMIAIGAANLLYKMPASATTEATCNSLHDLSKSEQLSCLTGRDRGSSPSAFVPLGDTDIRSALFGKWFSPDPENNPPHLRFSEYFGEDGSWKSIRYERGPDILIGKWTVKDGKLCVTSTSSIGGCRAIFLGDHGNIAFSDIRNNNGSGDPLLMVSQVIR